MLRSVRTAVAVIENANPTTATTQRHLVRCGAARSRSNWVPMQALPRQRRSAPKSSRCWQIPSRLANDLTSSAAKRGQSDRRPVMRLQHQIHPSDSIWKMDHCRALRNPGAAAAEKYLLPICDRREPVATKNRKMTSRPQSAKRPERGTELFDVRDLNTGTTTSSASIDWPQRNPFFPRCSLGVFDQRERLLAFNMLYTIDCTHGHLAVMQRRSRACGDPDGMRWNSASAVPSRPFALMASEEFQQKLF